MECAPPPTEWHVQDWLLSIEALASSTHPDSATPRERRAWTLLDSIAVACNIDPVEYVFEIDDSWGPETAVSAEETSLQPTTVVPDSDWELIETALSEFAETAADPGRAERAGQLAAAIADRKEVVVNH